MRRLSRPLLSSLRDSQLTDRPASTRGGTCPTHSASSPRAAIWPPGTAWWGGGGAFPGEGKPPVLKAAVGRVPSRRTERKAFLPWNGQRQLRIRAVTETGKWIQYMIPNRKNNPHTNL